MADNVIRYKYTMDGKQFEKDLISSEKAAENLKRSLLGLGAAGIGFAALAFKAADMASDLDEAKNVVTQSLGEMSESVIKWSENSIQAMGISQTEALKTAGIFGNLGTGLGFPVDEAADMATTLTQLSADMASFYNVSQEQAASALKGVYTGESEALKEYGVILTESNLAQYGYNSSMTEAEKIQIRYQAVLDQTANAQGDFARTSDGMANQTRIAQEQFKQLFTVIGEKLIPAVTKIILLLNDSLSAAIAVVNGDTKNLTEEQMGLYNTFMTMIPIVTNIAKILAIAGAAYIAFNAIIVLANALMVTSNAIKSVWAVVTGAQTIAQIGLNTAMLPFIAIAIAIIAIIAAIIAIFLNWGDIVDFMKEKWEQFKTYMLALFEKLKSIFSATFGAIKTIIYTYFQVYKTIIFGVLKLIYTNITVTLNSIKNYITTVMNVIKTFISSVWNNIKLIFSSVLGLIKGIVTGDMNLIKTSISGIMNGIKGVFNAALEAIKGLFSAAFQLIYDNTIGKLVALKDVISETIGGIKDSISSGLSALNPFSKASAQVNPLFAANVFGTGQAASNISNQTTYIINNNTQPLTLAQMHRQAQIVRT